MFTQSGLDTFPTDASSYGPNIDSLSKHKLLRHEENDTGLAVAHFLSELLRLTSPNILYKEDTVWEVLQLIIESFGGLGDIRSYPLSKRAN